MFNCLYVSAYFVNVIMGSKVFHRRNTQKMLSEGLLEILSFIVKDEIEFLVKCIFSREKK